MPPTAPNVNNNVDFRYRLLHIVGMAKTPPVGIRLDPDVKLALERAAKADARSVSSLASKIIAEWVAANVRRPGADVAPRVRKGDADG